MKIEPIVDNTSLAEFCKRQSKASFIAVDTEFVREKTYWPILCLVQIAGPEENAAIDALAPGIDLTPVDALLTDPNILKVFHAGRQDIEIFFHRDHTVPAPIFDSQVAAMVCGFGDQVAYDRLVDKLLGVKVEKSSRFADWSRRPLSQKQLKYALADVIHLRDAYEALAERLEESGRAHWLEEEMAILTDPATYRLDPELAWRRIKSRGNNPRFLGILREVAAWREREAQQRDLPRNRVLRDNALLGVASHAPETPEQLTRSRGISAGFAKGRMAEGLIEAVKRGAELDSDELPRPLQGKRVPNGVGPLTDLLKTLLKHNCEKNHVATRLVANVDDLQQIAADDDADVPALKGWRRELFGEQALALKHGRLAMTAKGSSIRLIELPDAK